MLHMSPIDLYLALLAFCLLVLCAALLAAKNAVKLERLIDRLERKSKATTKQIWRG
jgi:hypothetical protein